MKKYLFGLCCTGRCAKPGFQILAIVVAAFVSQAAFAVPIVVDGRLQGATDVDVNGTLYDVEFVDGLFNDIFGDDPIPSFVADNFFDALQFGQALIDSELLDGPLGMFDSQPELTNGCPDPTYCEIHTPFAFGDIFPFSNVVSTAAAINLNIDSDGAANNFRVSSTQSTVGRTRVWAVWTPTPTVVAVAEPGSLVLLAAGLLGLGFMRRKQAA